VSTGKSKQYDDATLVADLATANLSRAAIAQKHGLSEDFIGEIARGDRRAELQPRLQAAADGLRDEARRLGASKAGGAIEALQSLVDDPDTPAETRRKAAGDLLKYALGDPSAAHISMTQASGQVAASLPGLREEDVPEFLEWLARERGGPTDDDGPGPE